MKRFVPLVNQGGCMKKMGSLFCLVTLFAMVLAMPAIAGPAAEGPEPVMESRLALATGGTSGTYYPIGAAIANVVSKNTKGIQVTAESTAGSVANLRMIEEKKVDLILSASNTASGAFLGEDPFKAPIKNMQGMMALYPETFQFVVLKSSGMKTLADLKGKKVAVGAAGSGTERTTKLLLEALGISYTDVKVQFLSFGEGVTALKDRIIDCAVVGAGTPTAAVVDASASLDIHLLDVEEAAYLKVNKDSPFIIRSRIPAGTYKGVDIDVNTVASPALLIVRDDLQSDVVYEIISSIFANLATIQASHAQGKNISLETALDGMSIPLHPGAYRFFKEKGMAK